MHFQEGNSDSALPPAPITDSHPTENDKKS